MGLIDSIKGLFEKKDFPTKLAEWCEAQNSPRIAKYTELGNEQDVRLLAIDALSKIQRDEHAVNVCMKLLREDDEEVRKAACKSLKKIGTKREVDQIYRIEEEEQDEKMKQLLIETALSCKERTPRFL